MAAVIIPGEESVASAGTRGVGLLTGAHVITHLKGKHYYIWLREGGGGVHMIG